MIPVKIEKEHLSHLHFPKTHPEQSKEKKTELQEKLRKATLMGNSDKVKCSIVFNDDEGLKQIDTTIWEYDDEYISIKGGITLHIKYVEDIVL